MKRPTVATFEMNARQISTSNDLRNAFKKIWKLVDCVRIEIHRFCSINLLFSGVSLFLFLSLYSFNRQVLAVRCENLLFFSSSLYSTPFFHSLRMKYVNIYATDGLNETKITQKSFSPLAFVFAGRRSSSMPTMGDDDDEDAACHQTYWRTCAKSHSKCVFSACLISYLM